MTGPDRRLDEEIQHHLDLLAAEYERRGLSRAAARAAARRAFGPVAPMKERARDLRRLAWVEDLARDLRYGVRTMRRQPVLTVIAALTLALGIGANTALFSVINAVMLTPLPVPRPGELRLFSTIGGPAPVPGFSFSYAVYEDLQRDAPAFQGIALFGRPDTMRLQVAGSPDASGALGNIDRVSAQAVSGNFFSMLGVRPVAGRVLVTGDDLPDTSMGAVVLSDRFWSRRFGRSPDAIGRGIIINDTPFTIVGVAARGFTGVQVGEHPDIWWPSRALPRVSGSDAPVFTSRALRAWRLIGRLAPGADPRQADAQAQAVFEIDRQDQLARTTARFGGVVPPEERARIQQLQMQLQPGAAGFTLLRWQFRQALLVLMALVVLVLLIACANVTNLLLARATARRPEMAVRMALGSGRSRLIRQLLAESTLIAGVGAVLGIGVAVAGARLVTSFLNAGQITIVAGLDRRVFAFTAAVSLLTAFLAGMLPAIASTRVELTGRKTGGTALRERLSVHHGVVGIQIALSIVVLVTAGLFLRTLSNLQRVDTGFEPDRLTIAAIQLPGSQPFERRLAVQRALLDQLNSLPGHDAALATFGFLSGLGWGDAIEVIGRASDPAAVVDGLLVSPGFFEVSGTRVVDGRGFSRDDDRRAEKIAVVNQTAARRFFGGNAIGSRFRLQRSFPQDTFTVIGVVLDSTYQSVRDEAGTPRPMVYFPRLSGPGARMAAGMNGVQIAVRTRRPAREVETSIRAAVRQAEPAAMVGEVRTMREAVQETLARETLLARLGASFGVVALVLGAIGVYGVRAYAVSRRVAEFGLRLALGASPHRLLWRVIGQGAALAGGGIVVGLVAASIATRLVRTLLFDVNPLDLTTFTAAAVIFGGVAVGASCLPARRAMQINPATALRAE